MNDNKIHYYWAEKGREKLTIVRSAKQEILNEQEYVLLLENRISNLVGKSERYDSDLHDGLSMRAQEMLHSCRVDNDRGIDLDEVDDASTIGKCLVDLCLFPDVLDSGNMKFPIQLKQDKNLEGIFNGTSFREWLQVINL
jgi:hypothetical protein|tara:strand:- start:71 stop:490 length:420 start_codon:yes stop_codon:yes gene_type:complete